MGNPCPEKRAIGDLARGVLFCLDDRRRDIRKFQRPFIKAVESGRYNRACLSLSRANGKTSISAYLLARAMTPGDPLNVPGKEYLLGAATLEQGRICFRMIRETLEPMGGFRFLDSTTKIGATHLPTNTRLRVFSSNAKAAFGIQGVPLLVLDEPGALETVGGELLATALDTSLSKPDSDLVICYVGTVAPSTSGWWADLIARGTHGKTYVQSIQGRADRWDSPHEIKKCNPLAWYFPDSRKQLLSERDEARGDPRLRARFQSFRLNLPSADESSVLLTVSDWEQLAARDVPDRDGRPLVAIDLGAGRSWSAAVAIWQSGRVESLAVAPGIPDIAAQEKRDRVPSGTYQQLVEGGALSIADGLRVQPVARLWQSVVDTWGRPAGIICDRFRVAELQDIVGGVPVEPRVSRWSNSSEDIRALRKLAGDGPMGIAPDSRDLLEASLSATAVKADDAGNVRLVKKGFNSTARDDVGAALVLAAGAFSRRTTTKRRGRYLGKAA